MPQATDATGDLCQIDRRASQSAVKKIGRAGGGYRCDLHGVDPGQGLRVYPELDRDQAFFFRISNHSRSFMVTKAFVRI